MRIPYRKPITSITTEQLRETLESFYGDGTQPPPLDFALTGPGWNDLIFKLHNSLKEQDPNYRIIQVKEKIGTLRYYADTKHDDANKLIAEAEQESSHTCEQCGRPGQPHIVLKWKRTLCSIDAIIDNINTRIWLIHRNTLTFGFRILFAIRRFIRKNIKTTRHK